VPGSETDSLASRGFVSFTAKLKPGTEPGYSIKNHASVWINSNAAAVSNTTSNYIAFPAAVFEVADNPISIRVFPNPFDNVANVVVEGIADKYDFELNDMTGRVVSRITSITTNTFQFNRQGLAAGVYIYRISSDNKPVGYGKLVIE